MVLQRIIWPEKSEQEEKELYYHGTPEYTEEGYLKIRANETVTFDTYFNCFSGRSWLENTVVSKCKFQLDIKGKGKLFLKTENGEIIGKTSFCGAGSTIVSLQKIEKKIYYLEFYVLEHLRT